MRRGGRTGGDGPQERNPGAAGPPGLRSRLRAVPNPRSSQT